MSHFELENVSPASVNAADVKNIQCLKSTMKENANVLLHKLKHLTLSVTGAGALEEKRVRGPCLFGGAAPCCAAACSGNLQRRWVTLLFPK